MKNNSSKPVILCVDDEKIVLDALNRQLQRYFSENYQFEFAESAEEALTIIKEIEEEGSQVVMLITDQIMPGMTGDELLTHVHKFHPKQIKILLTGQASIDSAVHAINNANLYRYLCKPWSENDFLLTVEKGLEQYFLKETTEKQLQVFRKFFPYQFLECLSKESILDIVLSDHVQREMSILFVDIRNFTTISEMLSTDENYTFINKYLEYIEPTITKNNGFVDKYIGDAVMALFQKPADALKASLDMQKALKQFNIDFKDEKFAPVTSGIGLHTGNLMLGILGVENRMQCTVISDAVNIASRLQTISAAAGGLIIASSTFMEKIGEQNYDKAQVRFLGKILVKGKKEIIPVYEVISFENDPQAHFKASTKEAFVSGLNLFLNKKFAEACVKFNSVLEQNLDDKTAFRYLNLSANYMLQDPGEDWEGIYMSDEFKNQQHRPKQPG